MIPLRGLNSRVEFYRKYGDDPPKDTTCWRILRWITNRDGFGISELNFMHWEIKRKVLNPLSCDKGNGSAWWRNLNLNLIINAQIAAEIYTGVNKTDPVTNEISLWLEYIKQPNAQSWYRAHNASIVKGYFDFVEDANKESVYEQIFMNEVLYRLLFAQAMVEDDTIFKIEGVILSNPMLPAVDLMVHIPSFYPDHYPMTKEEIQDVLEKGHSFDGDLERDFDEWLIIPQIPFLYKAAAKWINIPALVALELKGKPVYPTFNPANALSS